MPLIPPIYFPNLLFNLLAGGALASAFVPTFTAFLVKDDHPSAWKLASAIVNLVVLALTTLSFISSLFATQIARLLAPHSNPPSTTLDRAIAQDPADHFHDLWRQRSPLGHPECPPALLAAVARLGHLLGWAHYRAYLLRPFAWEFLGWPGGRCWAPACIYASSCPISSACQNGTTLPLWDWATLPFGK